MNIKCVPLFNGSFNQTRYAYVTRGPENKMSVLIIDPMEEKIVKTTLFNSGKDFVAAISQHFGGKQKIQVALFEIFNYQNHGYDYVERFIQSIRAACNQLRVAHYFIPLYELGASSALVAAKNVDAKYGDSLFLVEVSDDEYQIGEFKYTKDGYKREGINSFDFVLKESPVVTLKNIMEFFEITELPQRIIVYAYSPETKFDRIKAIFNPKPVTTISSKEIHAGRIKYICCIAPFILRKSPSLFVPMFNQNYFIPTLPEPYVVTALIGDNMFTVAEFEQCEDLPAEKNIVLSRSIDRCAVIIGRCTGNVFAADIKFNSNVHKNELCVFIDAERTIKYKIKEIMLPQIKTLPNTLNGILKKKADKIPVIGFFDNSSIICIPDKNLADNYNFMKEWNGVYGQDLFINFGKKQTQFGNDAVKAVSSKLESVVFDVLKIMSMPADQIKDEVDKNDKWKFTITNDSNNPVLIEFDNFNGKKNAQSPQFFMAMLLKEHNRAITNKLGQKPKELGSCLFDEFTDDERKRVEDGLTEACKLLKQECRFISLK